MHDPVFREVISNALQTLTTEVGTVAARSEYETFVRVAKAAGIQQEPIN